MTKAYDNWERLVRATLRRHELWQLCHDHSRTPSGGSTTSGASPGSSSPTPEVAPKSSSTRVSPLNHQNRQGGAESKSSGTRPSPLNHQNRQGGAESKSSGTRPSPLNHQNRQGGAESKSSGLKLKTEMSKIDDIWGEASGRGVTQTIASRKSGLKTRGAQAMPPYHLIRVLAR
ncbi:hypothetical protein Pfo_014711 [Paulownia fortunei]|nr:hypothetical protein Pfo_014711 [Paulownia fortunei]